MGKIGILTYFNYINYGSMLQGFATQKAFLKHLKDSSDCTLINYRYQSPVNMSKISMLRLRLKRFFHYIKSIQEIYIKSKYSSKINLKSKKFEEFRLNYTQVTDFFYRNKKQLEQNPPIFDVYVTGSDQTWSPRVSGGYNETPMFLNFAIPGSKKGAYAPSLGTPIITDNDRNILKTELKGFEILSCRENSGAEILREITGKDVKKVLDPTLLLTDSEWRNISIAPSIKKGKYILCYFLGDRLYYRKFANKLSLELNLPIYYIPVSWRDCKKKNNLLFDVGPREFIGLIDNAKVVLTDSFHGTAFSSNLNTPFYSFVKHSGGKKSADNSRLFDFLSSINLENRMIESYDDDSEIQFEEINFTPVNDILEKQRSLSFEVIKSIVDLAESNV